MRCCMQSAACSCLQQMLQSVSLSQFTRLASKCDCERHARRFNCWSERAGVEAHRYWKFPRSWEVAARGRAHTLQRLRVRHHHEVAQPDARAQRFKADGLDLIDNLLRMLNPPGCLLKLGQHAIKHHAHADHKQQGKQLGQTQDVGDVMEHWRLENRLGNGPRVLDLFDGLYRLGLAPCYCGRQKYLTPTPSSRGMRHEA